MKDKIKVRMTNRCQIEGYCENISMKEQKGKPMLVFDLTNFHVTKPNEQGKAKGYGLPLVCRCYGATATRVNQLIRNDDLIMVEGKLRYHKGTGKYSLVVVHIEHTTPVIKEVDKIDFSESEEVEE